MSKRYYVRAVSAMRNRTLALADALGSATLLPFSPAQAEPVSEPSRRSVGLLDPQTFSIYGHYALVAYCASAPLSIALGQTIIVALLLYWLAVCWSRRNRLSLESSLKGASGALARPMIYWVVISLLAALVGIDPGRALPQVIKTSFYLLLPFCVVSILSLRPLSGSETMARIRVYLMALAGGQAVAAIHTIITSAFGEVIPLRPPGPVTESGQIVLVSAALLGLTLVVYSASEGGKTRIASSTPLSLRLMPWIVAGGLLVFCWADQLVPPSLARFSPIARLIGLGAALSYTPQVIRALSRWLRKPLLFRNLESREFRTVIAFTATLIFVALLLNLKRGPWLGVCATLVTTGLFLSRRVAYATVVLSIALVTLLAPARERVLHFADHFVISGGRQSMWALGLELVERFPLGLGLKNAVVIRQLDPTLPEEHRHMHNNLLNVSAENGLLGLMVYGWWIFVAASLGFACWRAYARSGVRLGRERAGLGLVLGCGLIGWQIAGLVEYNFGDGEVWMIALVFMGLLLALNRSPAEHEST